MDRVSARPEFGFSSGDIRVDIGSVTRRRADSLPISSAEPVAAEERIEDADGFSALASLAKRRELCIAAGHLILHRDRMLSMNAPGERCVCTPDIVVAAAAACRYAVHEVIARHKIKRRTVPHDQS